MLKFIGLVILSGLSFVCNAHEQWLLTSGDIQKLTQQPPPYLFTHFTPFNVTVLSLTCFFLMAWVVFNYKTYRFSYQFNTAQLSWSLRFLQGWLGAMLILSSLGLLPKEGVLSFTEPTLLAPDLLVSLHPKWWVLARVELLIGILLVIGIYTRYCALALIGLLFISFYLYGTALLHYAGFYLAASLFLLMNSGDQPTLSGKKNTRQMWNSLFIAQVLIGLNFIYSALSVKYLHPNLDIHLLSSHHAFTFGLPYPEFVFLMLIVELTVGLLFILGWRLRWVSLVLLGLFIFLSINLSENMLSHSFIYGILAPLILLQGYPLVNFCKDYLNKLD